MKSKRINHDAHPLEPAVAALVGLSEGRFPSAAIISEPLSQTGLTNSHPAATTTTEIHSLESVRSRLQQQLNNLINEDEKPEIKRKWQPKADSSPLMAATKRPYGQVTKVGSKWLCYDGREFPNAYSAYQHIRQLKRNVAIALPPREETQDQTVETNGKVDNEEGSRPSSAAMEIDERSAASSPTNARPSTPPSSTTVPKTPERTSTRNPLKSSPASISITTLSPSHRKSKTSRRPDFSGKQPLISVKDRIIDTKKLQNRASLHSLLSGWVKHIVDRTLFSMDSPNNGIHPLSKVQTYSPLKPLGMEPPSFFPKEIPQVNVEKARENVDYLLATATTATTSSTTETVSSVDSHDASGKSKEELLQEHREHWRHIRKQWMVANTSRIKYGGRTRQYGFKRKIKNPAV